MKDTLKDIDYARILGGSINMVVATGLIGISVSLAGDHNRAQELIHNIQELDPQLLQFLKTSLVGAFFIVGAAGEVLAVSQLRQGLHLHNHRSAQD